MEDLLKNAKSIRLMARLADQACAAPDADEEAKQYNEEELHITPLHVASFNGDIEAVKTLLKDNADVNAQDKLEWTPLHDAAIQGHVEIAKLLIAAGANVDAQDIDDLYTPLHDGVRMNHPEIVQVLLAARADATIEDRWHNTPLTIAQEYRYDNIIKQLEKYRS